MINQPNGFIYDCKKCGYSEGNSNCNYSKYAKQLDNGCFRHVTPERLAYIKEYRMKNKCKI